MKESATFLQILSNIVLWCIFYFSTKSVLRKPFVLSKNKVNFAYLLLIIFCLFPFFGGDYFHYKEIFFSVQKGWFAHLEPIYIWLIDTFGYSYECFRFIVWGSALFILFKAYNRLEVNPYLALFFFGSLYLLWFSYARASLAMAMLFLGLSYLAKPLKGKYIYSLILAFVFLVCALFFHRSAILGFICVLGSLFLKKPKRKTVILLSVLFPLLISLLAYFISYFMDMSLGDDAVVSEQHRNAYLNSEAQSGLSVGIGPYIGIFCTRFPLLLIGYAFIQCAFKGYFEYFTQSSVIVSSYAFLLILLALAFSFDLGFNTYVLYYRTLTFAMIPSVVFLIQLKELHILPTLYKYIYNITLFGVFYNLIYATYCTLV